MIRDMTESVVRAGALQGFEATVREAGGAPGPLLRRHGLGALDDPEALVPLSAAARLLEDAARTLEVPDFGLRLSAHQDASALGALAVVIRNAPTVERAITDGSRYLLVHSPAYALVLDARSALVPDCAAVRFELRVDPDVPQRQFLDGCLGVTHRLAVAITGGRFRPRAVSLPHTPLAPESVYRRFFGAPVRFEQPHAALHADHEVLRADLADADPVLQEMAMDYIARHVRPRAATTADLVRETLSRTLGAVRGTKGEIAALLYLHPRTLQRRLDAEATSFQALRDEVYGAAALRYLRETSVPLTQVAGALGYSEHAAFTRACRRWFGETPSALRAAAFTR